MSGRYNLMLAGQILASRLDIASPGGKHDSFCFEIGEPAGILRAIDASDISLAVVADLVETSDSRFTDQYIRSWLGLWLGGRFLLKVHGQSGWHRGWSCHCMNHAR